MTEEEVFEEIDLLSGRIRNNTATLSDYYRYEQLLTDGGMPYEFIQKVLDRVGFHTWEELLQMRQDSERDKFNESTAVGSVLGFGTGYKLWSGLKSAFRAA